jgi:rhodanese-related sulfurtransferase
MAEARSMNEPTELKALHHRLRSPYLTDGGDVGANELMTVEAVIKDAYTGVNYISIDELKVHIQANPRLVLLDVRTAREYEGGRIKGSAWVERGVAEFVLVRQLPDPDAEIVVYCKVGHRAGYTVTSLRRVGYRNVVVLKGGFDEWAKQGNPVHNFLGEFKLVSLIERNAGSREINFFEDKK